MTHTTQPLALLFTGLITLGAWTATLSAPAAAAATPAALAASA